MPEEEKSTTFQIITRVEALEAGQARLQGIVETTAQSVQKNSETLGQVLTALQGRFGSSGIVENVSDHEKRIRALEDIATGFKGKLFGAAAVMGVCMSLVFFLVDQLIKN